MRIGIAASAALLWLVACASGKPGGVGDVDAPPGGVVDAAPDAPITHPDAPVDGPPGAGFGQPCTANQQCESGICILSGTHGTCTRLCNNDCPDGYSCLGVDGAVIDGQVSFVCVPQTNQLCSPCSQDSECTQLGQDKCITFADGDKACGEDCTNISCPTGYQCNTIGIGGLNYKQCMPTSNACDCTAATPGGTTQACSITTPLGTQCAGTQACGGASGWGACAPPSATDAPDDNYTDQNCDGIDGDASAGIFVASGGSNDIDCGLTTATPCQTIQWGLTRAAAEAFKWVYVQNGTYNGPIAMKDGINVVGGYNTVWARDAYTVSGHLVTIQGANPAVTFMNLTQTTKLVDVVVHGSDATSAGGSAVGVFVSNSSSVELHGVQVTSGVGGAGSDGSTGATGTDAGDGGDGNPGVEDSSGLCDSNPHPAPGTAGTSSCGRPGGRGGNAGWSNVNNYGGAGWGEDGQTGTGGASGGQGAHCKNNRACDGTVGNPGGNGSTGSLGSGGGAFGSFSGTTYAPSNGTNGGDGTVGQGGGGGGGGGGGETDCDSTGSSGGGGGGGGCGGGHGFGGKGGGGSFAVVTSDSVLVIVKSLVMSGTGGHGGAGGGGGMYGAGGSPGAGGPYGGSSEQDDGGDGAGGGHGGHGGLGGQGGGGGGGPSIPVVCLGSSATNAAQSGSTLTPGSGGVGGSSAAAGTAGTNPQNYNCTAF